MVANTALITTKRIDFEQSYAEQSLQMLSNLTEQFLNQIFISMRAEIAAAKQLNVYRLSSPG